LAVRLLALSAEKRGRFANERDLTRNQAAMSMSSASCARRDLAPLPLPQRPPVPVACLSLREQV